MLMVKSANDMAVAIAEGVGGSIEGFADMMNANARRLGMTQSNFVNPNGLPAENHVTSARDLGILARALIREFPERRFVLAHLLDPLRQPRAAQLQFADRPLSRRRRHEDRLHLRLRLQCGRVRDPQRPPADRGHARRLFRRGARAEGGAAARARLQQRRPVLADAVARHRRRAGADRRPAAESARGNVRRSPPQAGGRRQRGRRAERRRRASATANGEPIPTARPSCCRA